MARRKKVRNTRPMHVARLVKLSDLEFVQMATNETMNWCLSQAYVCNKYGLINTFRRNSLPRLFAATLERGMSRDQALFVVEFVFRESLFLFNQRDANKEQQ